MRLSIFFITMFFFIGCQPFPETKMNQQTFIIENGIDMNIQLQFFLFIDEDPELVNLNENEKYFGNIIESTGPKPEDNPNGSSAGRSLMANKINVIFNNERILESSVSETNTGLGFFTEPILRNLLRNGNYIPIGNDKYLFTITQEDFDNATPCDGPCL